MHHKVIIIDARTVVAGSYNFSQNAETQNDENVLIVHDAGTAARYTQEFERLIAR
jgi:phosphatidylserine/phosphatidylglycerophosphate/cardiolipin synthase-like enzyme